MDLVDRLEDELRSHLLTQMPTDPTGELSSKDLGSLLIIWFNWRDRTIAARPRTVHVAVELSTSSKSTEHAASLAALTAEVERGADLAPRLSACTAVAYIPESERSEQWRRDDLDLLLADWGVHHLHLLETYGGARGPDLLFAAFKPGDAYFIGIYPHGAWTDLGIVETIVRNWPIAGILLGSHSGLRLATQPTAVEYRKMRRSGVFVPIEVDGVLFFPRGQSMAGTAMDAAQRSNHIMHALRGLREQSALPPDAATAWSPYVDAGTFGVEETSTGRRVPLGNLG